MNTARNPFDTNTAQTESQTENTNASKLGDLTVNLPLDINDETPMTETEKVTKTPQPKDEKKPKKPKVNKTPINVEVTASEEEIAVSRLKFEYLIKNYLNMTGKELAEGLMEKFPGSVHTETQVSQVLSSFKKELEAREKAGEILPVSYKNALNTLQSKIRKNKTKGKTVLYDLDFMNTVMSNIEKNSN